jgi:hypothetical protein
MVQQGGWPRLLARCVLAAGLLGNAGCLGFLHPVDMPYAKQLTEPCQAVPKCCRDHVYVFMVNGLDPWNYGNLTGVRDYIQELGFNKTYYGQVYHVWWFNAEIRRIHQQDPHAHFAIVGFSVGANLAHTMADAVHKDGVMIDLFVLLSGNHIVKALPQDRPENVGRIINILASGTMQSFGERDWAENVRLDDAWHFDSPTHHYSLETLSQELSALAATVPVIEPVEQQIKPLEETPTPRPLKKIEETAQRDEWDFLKPVSQLGGLRPSPGGSRPVQGTLVGRGQ